MKFSMVWHFYCLKNKAFLSSNFCLFTKQSLPQRKKYFKYFFRALFQIFRALQIKQDGRWCVVCFYLFTLNDNQLLKIVQNEWMESSWT